MVTSSIWKDVSYTSSTTPLKYSISVDDNEIFNGIAYARPGSEYVIFNINKICQNWVSSNLPDIRTFTGTYTHSDAFKTFVLKDASGNTLETYRFLYDWSYDNYFTGQTCNLNKNINSKAAYGQLQFNTNFNGSAVTTTVSASAGNTCGEWAIYYLNRYGGWDSFLIEGNVVKKDVYEKYYTNKSFNNTSLDFERKVYNNQITTNYEVNTSWLKDAESNKLAFNLLPSNCAYLHDLVNNVIKPVIITNTEVEYKKFINGKKLNKYTITVENSQSTQNI